ncbi:MAG: PQQ-dependent sugar dehydrogenase [Verrucomicrobiales bacterium]|nr:PQQ-dependent sugar dehydrogenase [Verrucomicrobiales bacterium]
MTIRIFFFLPLLVGMASLQAAFPTVSLQPVILDQLHAPTNITHAGDGTGRLFVCDQPGTIHVIEHGMLLPTPFLNLIPKAFPQTTGYSERGLLGLAFHPDYGTPASPGEGRFYVYFSAPDGNNMNSSTPQNHVSVIAEYTVSPSDPNLADPASERILLTFGQPQGNHNGGQLAFGPDGYLYIGTGDGGSSNDNNAGHTGGSSSRPVDNLGNSLDRTRLLGKILRIDVFGSDGQGGEYGIPGDNPFVGSGGGVREEIFAEGLRNPWRFSFDDGPGGTNRLFCGDVGQGKVEEINLIVSGGNYGWRYKEGEFVLFPNMAIAGNAPEGSIDPIAQYAHPGITIGNPTLPPLGFSVTGGFVYRGDAIPGLQGRYLFADYGKIQNPGSGLLMALTETSPGAGTFTLTPGIPVFEGNPIPAHILCLGTNEAGEIFVGTKTSSGVLELDSNDGLPAGGIYKLVPLEETFVTMTATRDGTLFDGYPNNASGAGERLFAGETGEPSHRRALIAFDGIPAIPAGQTLISASVTLEVQFGAGSFQPFTLHRVNESWGEGASNSGLTGGTGTTALPGDATWNDRFHSTTPWNIPGGSFETNPSASTLVGNSGMVQWSSPELISDLNFWSNNPAGNHGWILIGNESAPASAKRIYSREAAEALRPKLNYSYAFPPTTPPLRTFLSTHFPGTPVGGFLSLASDDDGDGIPLLLEYAYGFSPHIFNPPSATELSLTATPGVTNSNELTISFRRNPETLDLTLNLQISPDLENWSTIAISEAGAIPVPLNGASLLSDDLLPGQGPARKTTVSIQIPSPGSIRQFARVVAVPDDT